MYSLYKRILSSIAMLLSMLSLTPLLLSLLYMRNGGENYFELICWCIPIPCLCFYVLSLY